MRYQHRYCGYLVKVRPSDVDSDNVIGEGFCITGIRIKPVGIVMETH